MVQMTKYKTFIKQLKFFKDFEEVQELLLSSEILSVGRNKENLQSDGFDVLRFYLTNTNISLVAVHSTQKSSKMVPVARNNCPHQRLFE